MHVDIFNFSIFFSFSVTSLVLMSLPNVLKRKFKLIFVQIFEAFHPKGF